MPSDENTTLLPQVSADGSHHRKSCKSRLSAEDKKELIRRKRDRESGFSFRKDVWTVLRYRTSVSHGSGLDRISYIVEVCVLHLIVVNVVVAIFDTSITGRVLSDKVF